MIFVGIELFVVVDGLVVYVLSSFLGKATGAARGVGSSPTGSKFFSFSVDRLWHFY